ncbi:MAG: hypothetical protein GXP58_05390 [Deltaproteobacteria bacterium]|nr:hypothetical protein [Deltaproteobacteria bacterium]
MPEEGSPEKPNIPQKDRHTRTSRKDKKIFSRLSVLPPWTEFFADYIKDAQLCKRKGRPWLDHWSHNGGFLTLEYYRRLWKVLKKLRLT